MTATDAPSIDATTYVGTAAKRTNDLGLGLLTTVIDKLRGEYQFTTGSGRGRLTFGDRVRVARLRGRGHEGALYEYMGTTQARDLGAQDFTNFELWKQLNDTTIVPQSVATAAVKALGLDNGGSKSYYGVVARNDVRGAAEASVVAARVSGRDIPVRALEAARLVALDNSTTVAQTEPPAARSPATRCRARPTRSCATAWTSRDATSRSRPPTPPRSRRPRPARPIPATPSRCASRSTRSAGARTTSSSS